MTYIHSQERPERYPLCRDFKTNDYKRTNVESAVTCPDCLRLIAEAEKLFQDAIAKRNKILNEIHVPDPNVGKAWSKSEIDIANRKDLNVQQIADLLGRSYSSVVAVRVRFKKNPNFWKD